MATAVIGALRVNLFADTAAFETGLGNARGSLGKFGRAVDDVVQKVVRIGVAAAASGAALLTGMFTNSAMVAKELTYLSQVAGEAPKRFQHLAFAAKTVGIEQEKLADILKDARDRVGDFLTTGAGPMADFFEQIAPKINMTAEEFKHLSGSEVLIKFQKALDDANVSASEQVFFMEAMASDSARLIPLLTGNAAALNELAREAEDLGVAMSDVDVVQLEQASRATSKIMDAVAGLSHRISAALAPAVNHVAEQLTTAAKESGGFADAIGTAVKFAVLEFGNLSSIWHQIRLDWDETVAFILDGINWIIRKWNAVAETIPGMSRLAVEEIQHDYGKLREQIGSPPSQADWEAWWEGLKTKARESAEVIAAARAGLADGESAETGPTAAERDQAAAEQEKLDAQLERLRASIMTKEELEYQSYQNQLLQLDEFYNNRMILEDEYQRLIEAARQQHEDSLSDIRDRAMREEMRARSDMSNRIVGVMGALGSALESQGDKHFGVVKALSIATALIKGWEAVTSSYAAGAKIGGPPLGIAYAALAAAQTAAQIASMRSVSSRGGGGSPGGATSSASAPETQQQAEPARERREISVRGIGIGEIFRGSQLRELINSIDEELGDGALIRAV